jgi:hypothetical protein
MQKPAKPAKKLKPTEQPPEEQVQLVTVCGFCRKHFPDPTTARIHMDAEHPR